MPSHAIPAGFLILILSLSVGCATVSAPAPVSATYVAPPFVRANDGLLYRADLQDVVGLQIRRDGASLVDLLRSEDPAIRARAAFALASVQDSTAIGALIAALADSNPLVRADAAFAIGQSADSTASSALLDALAEPQEDLVAAEIIEALGKVGDRTSLIVLAGRQLPPSLAAIRSIAIGRYGIRGHHEPVAHAILIQELTSSVASNREAAAYYFGRITSAEQWRTHGHAVRRAYDALPAGDPARMHLALGLGRLGDADDFERLIVSMTSDPDWRVRTNAARALGAHAAHSAVANALIEAVSDPVAHVGLTAATSLQQKADWTTEELDSLQSLALSSHAVWQASAPLLPILARSGRASAVRVWQQRQANPFARTAAIAGFAAATDDESEFALFEAAADTSSATAAAALSALRTRWQRDRLSSGQRGIDLYFETFMQAVERLDVATAYTAAPVLSDSLFEMRGSVPRLIAAYERMEVPRDIEPMLEIVKVMGQVSDTAAVDFLVGVVLEGHQVLRQTAANALEERLTEGINIELTGNGRGLSTPNMAWDVVRRLGPHPRLVLETDRGRVVIEMDATQAPQTVQAIAHFARSGAYNGVPFHRVVPNFVIQGGDYARGDGFGGPDYQLRSEFTRIRYYTGTAGMASAGKDTEGSQYFAMHSHHPHLDGRYTAFGRVIAGIDVVDAILVGDRVIRATIMPDPAAPANGPRPTTN